MGILDKIKKLFNNKKGLDNEQFDVKINKDSADKFSNLDKVKGLVLDPDEVQDLDKDSDDVPTPDEVPDLDLDKDSDEVQDLDKDSDDVPTPDEVPDLDLDKDSEEVPDLDECPDSNAKKEGVNLFAKSKELNDEKLDKTLNKTRDGFLSKMKMFFSGKTKIDDIFLDKLEEMLIVADIGIETTVKIIDLVENYVSKNKYLDEDELKLILKKQIVNLLSSEDICLNELGDSKKPHVVLFVGVNGVGKTTTIAKLAYSLKNSGNKVVIGAADTFRAAAIDQLDSWAKKINVSIIKQKMGSDPASVAFDTVQSAISNKSDYVLIDTAGRLHNKVNLMMELEKINKVIKKILPDAPQEVILVLDASTGQNALEQAKQFLKATHVTHLALTKLDGTAKGGVVISICDQLNIPIKYIGVGEKIDDIQFFNKTSFVESLFK